VLRDGRTTEAHCLSGLWNALWAKRKYWLGQIVFMIVVGVILFIVAYAARIVPFFNALFYS
jgi:hypothetical protein